MQGRLVRVARSRSVMALGGVALALAIMSGAVAGMAAGERVVSAECFGPATKGGAFGVTGRIEVGTSRKETILGTEGNDVIISLGGNDLVFGMGGADRICTGPGRDTVWAGNGPGYRLDGGDGNDILVGPTGSGVIFGGRGVDTCLGGRIVVGCEKRSNPVAQPGDPPRAPAPQPSQPSPGPASVPYFELGPIECLDGGQLNAYPPRVMKSVYDVNFVNAEIVRWQPVLQVQTASGWTDYGPGKPIFQAFTTSSGVYQDAYDQGGWRGPDNQRYSWVPFGGLLAGTYRVRNLLYWDKLGKWYHADSRTCGFS